MDDGMGTRQTLTLRHERFRIGPWHADPQIAYVTAHPAARIPTVDGLRLCVDRIAEQGYSAAISAALHPDEAAPFLQSGFVEYDRLRVLAHDLSNLEFPGLGWPEELLVRRARRSDRVVALEVDNRAFPSFWRLDGTGLKEALTATPHTRFRLAVTEGQTVGYSVIGRAMTQGFLQRLATDPGFSGRGVGSSLVIDALRWSRRRNVQRVLVNTQSSNSRALALYDRLGFRLTATDLVVLIRTAP